jgi:DNA invertase Pin-like site-specific DNA recombinase
LDNTPVAIYVRVSSLEQAENGWSIEGQIKEIRQHCENKGCKAVRLYKDEGYSASTIERPALQKMLEHSIEKKFEKIIIWKYDRLSRNDMDFFALIHFLNKNKIVIESINEPTPNDGSPYNEFIIGILGLISSLERRVFLMRSKMGRKVRAEKGLWKGGRTPYGYDYNENTGFLEINGEEAEVVRFIFNRYLECVNYHEVARNLNAMEIKPRYADKWADNTIKVVLINRNYIGEYSTNGFTHNFDDYRIIDDEIFDLVQKRIGKGQHIPYGYKWDLELGKMITKPEEVEVVKKVFELFSDDRTLYGVRHYLMDNNILTRYHKNRRWLENTIVGILTNPVYIGYSCGLGNKFEFIYDETYQIIDTDLFLEVQLIGETNYRSFKPRQRRIKKLREKLFNEIFSLEP